MAESLNASIDHIMTAMPPTIEIVVDRIEEALLTFIHNSYCITGCQYYLTNKDILGALKGLRGGCQLVLHHHSWIDNPDKQAYKDSLATYKKLKSSMPGVPPIMITGGKNPNGIMHHKFLVSWRETPYGVIPFGAWSGSYNLSQASNNNAENIIILWDHKSAHKYSGEHLALLKVAYKIGKKNHK